LIFEDLIDMIANFKNRLSDAPRTLAWIFGVTMVVSLVLGALTFNVTTLIRWIITFSLMYAVLCGDKIWASVLSGLFVVGAFFTTILFWGKFPAIAVGLSLFQLWFAYYLMLSKDMKAFFARKNELQEKVSE
jgi:hypothetical protein